MGVEFSYVFCAFAFAPAFDYAGDSVEAVFALAFEADCGGLLGYAAYEV